MKRISVLLIAFAALVLISTAAAAPGPKLDKHDISAKQCQLAGSHQLVDVNYTILNDADSNVAGGYWANDTIKRHVRIFSESDNTFCVVVEDHGKFVTFDSSSPNGTGHVTAGITGNIEGGYITSDVQGTFAPTLATHGNLGTFDLQCDSSGNCPGTVPSWHDYFSSIVSANDFAQWGWLYKAGHNGTWLNQDSGNAGDITG